jgi:pyruvate dehydrogenase E2 component (dihydrolipoamide acetyltransferase)
MATDVLMPKLSDTMEEGKILKWLKQPGDVVKSGDLLAEVETDKANMEIEAFDEGVVTELKVAEGESAPVGAVIAVLGAAGEAAAPRGGGKAPARESADASSSAPKAGARGGERTAEQAETGASAPPPSPRAAPARQPERSPATAPSREPRAASDRAAPATAVKETGDAASAGVKASPLARKVAAERGIDLARVRGTGPGGRIVEKDLDAAGTPAERAPERPAAAERPAPVRAATARAAEGEPPREPVAAGRREFSRMRKTTAKRMADAKRDIPHFYVSGDLAMDEAVRLREGLAALGGDFEGITLTHLVVKACGVALRRVPEMNASFDVDGVVVHEHVNVGIAAATDDGLLVPVLRDVDRAPLANVVRDARAAIGRARAGKPSGEDLSGGTFTVSNLGMFPVTHFAAVVNPPQAAILAVGTVRDVPVVRAGAIVPGRMMMVTLSCDHRVVDGALAGRFLAELKAVIEQPLALVV